MRRLLLLGPVVALAVVDLVAVALEDAASCSRVDKV
jgi:hypothetical protein